MMKKLAIVFAVGAAVLMGGSAAYAADSAVKEIWPSRRTVAPIGEARKHEHRHGSARPPERAARTR